MKFKPKSRFLASKTLLFRMKYAISELRASFLAFVKTFAKKKKSLRSNQAKNYYSRLP